MKEVPIIGDLLVPYGGFREVLGKSTWLPHITGPLKIP